MIFHSILFERPEDSIRKEPPETHAFFGDLNLDQVIETITAGRQEYNFKPFFYSPLSNIEGIEYRHEIMQDLEDKILFESIKAFAQEMRSMRQNPAFTEKLDHRYHKEGWVLRIRVAGCQLQMAYQPKEQSTTPV